LTSAVQAELLDRYTPAKHGSDTSATHLQELGVAHSSFMWSVDTVAEDGAKAPNRTAFRLTIADPVIFARGKLNMITGSTGSGKTSLLLALLGEMHYVPTGPGSWVNIPRDGGIAYCAQESWVQSLTIRDNILFGKAYDETRYKKGTSMLLTRLHSRTDERLQSSTNAV
jgi:ABC-type uncharacterized transport system fused permease/ATPase subunit